jgi:hypothetical protein
MLKHTMAAIPGGNTRRTYGTAFWDGSKWSANVGGNLLTCRWLDPIQPVQGGNLVIDITTDERGQSTALVIGGYADQPRPSTGTVLTVGVSQIVFTGEDATTYSTDRFIGTYTVGDLIYLTWDAAKPTIIGKIPAITVTPPANTPVPAGGGGAITGTHRTPATKSDTYGVGGWGRWSTSQYGGEDVYSGTYGGYTVTGSWFYGLGNTVLAGRTIAAARFRLPQRLNVGASGSATVHLYAHTSSNEPGGDVNRTVGPFDVSVAQNAPPQWVTLPSTFYSALTAGGGISLAGDPYVGFQSRLKDPDSGKLELDWMS